MPGWTRKRVPMGIGLQMIHGALSFIYFFLFIIIIIIFLEMVKQPRDGMPLNSSHFPISRSPTLWLSSHTFRIDVHVGITNEINANLFKCVT